jgi:hypothetical protein
VWFYGADKIPGMAKRRRCELCRCTLPPHGFYLVRIDVYAEPSLPDVDSDQLEEMDLDQTMKKLIAQMKHMSADDLQDQVHRRFEYALCADCQQVFLSNPLGKPRARKVGDN